MDFLDRMLGHDAWTTRQLLLLAMPLTDADLDREFDIGLRTLRATFRHVIHNTNVWEALMAGDVPRTKVRCPLSIAEMIVAHDAASTSLAMLARDVAARGAWDELFHDVLVEPPQSFTLGAGIAHVLTHSMHHRGQIIHMMKKLGVENVPEGDVMSWEFSRAD